MRNRVWSRSKGVGGWETFCLRLNHGTQKKFVGICSKMIPSTILPDGSHLRALRVNSASKHRLEMSYIRLIHPSVGRPTPPLKGILCLAVLSGTSSYRPFCLRFISLKTAGGSLKHTRCFRHRWHRMCFYVRKDIRTSRESYKTFLIKFSNVSSILLQANGKGAFF